ncbi:MAG TPA: hypothetical protein PLJ78_13005 [Anaerolineae bacterium]|nr:hypothetical protein [Anaerolineae bacterium]HQK14848.1 hypothetical protein [Anaerolineae bacterium]
MSAAPIPQPYPRISDPDDKAYGCLDTNTLKPHPYKIPVEVLTQMIREAIDKANQKSSRESISIPADATTEDLSKAYRRAGKDLFRYFKRYYEDPASTAHQVYKKHYRDVGVEQFRSRVIQKGRMNSGWRYQFLLLDCAVHSQRFKSVSDLGLAEADFSAVIEFVKPDLPPLSLYVSVKNRRNTLGGQDWPKSIRALETVAMNDRNRIGPYCCVFGIAMDRGQRSIKIEQRTGQAYSANTEVWLSDFLWPFFANYSYEEIMKLVLDVLLSVQESEKLISQIQAPDEVLESFGLECRKAGLVNDEGYFDDPYKLIQFFCK